MDQEYKSVAIMARAAKRFALEDGVLQVGFDSPVFCDALSKPGNLVLLTKMLQQVSPGMELKLSKGWRRPLGRPWESAVRGRLPDGIRADSPENRPVGRGAFALRGPDRSGAHKRARRK